MRAIALLALVPTLAMAHGHRPRESIRDCMAIQELAIKMGEEVARRVTAATKPPASLPHLQF
jgi:hypothetical protein